MERYDHRCIKAGGGLFHEMIKSEMDKSGAVLKSSNSRKHSNIILRKHHTKRVNKHVAKMCGFYKTFIKKLGQNIPAF